MFNTADNRKSSHENSSIIVESKNARPDSLKDFDPRQITTDVFKRVQQDQNLNISKRNNTEYKSDLNKEMNSLMHSK